MFDVRAWIAGLPPMPARVRWKTRDSAYRPDVHDEGSNQGRRKKLPFDWGSAIARDPGEELREIVEDLLTAGGLSVMYGESNSGKTFLATHLAFSVVEGIPCLGKRVERGAVIYVAAEGSASIRQRIRAYRVRHRGRELKAFGLVSTALNLLSPSADIDALVALVAEKAAEIGMPVLLIIVDTLARVMLGGDENTAVDMGRLVTAGDRIRRDTGAHVMFIHHSGKDALRGARGHSSLRAALDTELEVTKDEGAKLHVLEVRKQRDLGSVGARLCAKFVVVELGTNQWGNQITSCVVEPASEAERKRSNPKPRGAVQRLSLQAIETAINLHGRHPTPLDFRKKAKGVTLAQARQEFDRIAGHIESKHRATRFAEGVTGLKASGHVGGVEDWIWLPSQLARTLPEYPGSIDPSGISGVEVAPNSPDSGNSGNSGVEV